MLEESFFGTPSDAQPSGIASRLPTDSSDTDLVGELLKNRPEAHRLAVQRFAPLVRRFARRSLGPGSDIDDLQQEVFCCLFQRLSTLRDPLALRPFVMAITLRIVLRERRRRRKFAHLTPDPDLARIGPMTKRDEAVASYALIRLRNLVLRLHERERRTFLLRFVEGMTVLQIAAALNLSEATTRRSFRRAWSFVSKCASRDPFLCDYFAASPAMACAD